MFARFGTFWSRSAPTAPSIFSYPGFITSFRAQNGSTSDDPTLWANTLTGVEPDVNARWNNVAVGELYSADKPNWLNHALEWDRYPFYCFYDDLLYVQGYEFTGDGVTRLPNQPGANRVAVWDPRSRSLVRTFDFVDTGSPGYGVTVTETKYWYGGSQLGFNSVITAVDKVTGQTIETFDLSTLSLTTLVPYNVYPLKDDLLLAYATAEEGGAGYNGGDGTNKIFVISRTSSVAPWTYMEVTLPGVWNNLDYTFNTALMPFGIELTQKSGVPLPFQYSFDPVNNEQWVCYFNQGFPGTIYAAKFNVLTGAVQTFSPPPGEDWSTRWIQFDRVSRKKFLMIDISGYNEMGCLELDANDQVVGIHGRWGSTNNGLTSVQPDNVWDHFWLVGDYLFATYDYVSSDMACLFKVGEPDSQPVGLVNISSYYSYTPPWWEYFFFVPPAERTVQAPQPIVNTTQPTTFATITLNQPFAVHGPFTIPAAQINSQVWMRIEYDGSVCVSFSDSQVWNGSSYEGYVGYELYLFSADGQFVQGGTQSAPMAFDPSTTPPGTYFMMISQPRVQSAPQTNDLFQPLNGFATKGLPDVARSNVYFISTLA